MEELSRDQEIAFLKEYYRLRMIQLLLHSNVGKRLILSLLAQGELEVAYTNIVINISNELRPEIPDNYREALYAHMLCLAAKDLECREILEGIQKLGVFAFIIPEISLHFQIWIKVEERLAQPSTVNSFRRSIASMGMQDPDFPDSSTP